MLVTNIGEREHIIHNDPSVDTSRLYTVRGFVTEVRELVSPSHVIIDESYHCYRKVDKNKIFEKIAEITTDVIVIEIN